MESDALQQRAETGAEKILLIGETAYEAERRPPEWGVVIKAEGLAKGPNTRFVVTTRPDPPETLSD